MQGKENGSCNGDAPRWDCAARGHAWKSPQEESPVLRICFACPALGGPCPDCGALGLLQIEPDRTVPCTRCRGSGVVELVEISAAEVADLRRDGRRFDWLLSEHAYQAKSRRNVVLQEIDELIAIGASGGKIRGMDMSEVARAAKLKRVKKPPAAQTTGGNTNAENVPAATGE